MKNKIFWIINIPLIIILLIVISWLLYAHYWHNPQYIEPTRTAGQIMFNVEREVTRETIRAEIGELFGNPSYTINDNGEDHSTWGLTNLLTRNITMYWGLSNASYAFTFAHELVHLTEWILNERYCQIKAFKILYESGNEYLRNCALNGVYLDLLGYYPKEYKFTGNVEQYLEEV